MKSEQKIVALGAASGVVLMALAVYGLYTVLPAAPGMDSIAFVLKMHVIALVPLFIMLIAVGNERFLSDAIDPTRHAEGKDIEVDGRVADNTLQQTFVFVVATLGLATVLPLGMGKLFAALTAVFVLARFAFWAGYRLNPLYRAPGMAATAYLNLGIILGTLYYLAVGGFY